MPQLCRPTLLVSPPLTNLPKYLAWQTSHPSAHSGLSLRSHVPAPARCHQIGVAASPARYAHRLSPRHRGQAASPALPRSRSALWPAPQLPSVWLAVAQSRPAVWPAPRRCEPVIWLALPQRVPEAVEATGSRQLQVAEAPLAAPDPPRRQCAAPHESWNRRLREAGTPETDPAAAWVARSRV